jgi:hypothetical protein
MNKKIWVQVDESDFNKLKQVQGFDGIVRNVTVERTVIYPAPEVVVVSGDNWGGLYVDGNLVYEHHNVDREDLMEILGIPFREEYIEQFQLDELEFMPKKLEDVMIVS